MNEKMSKTLFKASILTYGCQMNIHDSERMGAALEKNGFTVLNELKPSTDVVIINTCSVREKPENKLSAMLHHVRGMKKRKPKIVVAVAGCVAQQKGESILKEFPFVDIVIGPDGIDKLMDYYNDVKLKKSGVVNTEFLDELSYTNTIMTAETASKSHAYVTAMKGCNSFCSFCIVPYVRGAEHSRSITEVTDDVRRLVDDGVTSITLLGQNIARFGKDTGENFPSLLHSVGDIKGLKRLSFLTSHPKDFSDEIIKCYEDISVMSPMLHLPTQHGSDKILKAMNRGYTRKQYMDIIDKLRKSKIWEGLALTTDVILGFPGEDEKDFKDLMSLLDYAEFDNSFSFIYSPRPGTVACKKYGAAVDKKLHKIYSDRLNTYQDRQKEVAFEKNKKLVGKTIEVLVEGRSDKDPERLTARTDGWKVVNFDAKQNISAGDYVMVKIVKAHPTHLKGEVVNDK